MPKIDEKTPENEEIQPDSVPENTAGNGVKKCLVLRRCRVDGIEYPCASVFSGTPEQVARLIEAGDGDDTPANVAWGEEQAR